MILARNDEVNHGREGSGNTRADRAAGRGRGPAEPSRGIARLAGPHCRCHRPARHAGDCVARGVPRATRSIAAQRALAEAGAIRYTAVLDGTISDGASMRLADGIAQLTGAATAPAHRRRGVQTALLSARFAEPRRLRGRGHHDPAGIEVPAKRPASGIRLSLHPRDSGQAKRSPELGHVSPLSWEWCDCRRERAVVRAGLRWAGWLGLVLLPGRRAAAPGLAWAGWMRVFTPWT